MSNDLGRVEIQAEYDDDSPTMTGIRVLRADRHATIANSLLLQARAQELTGITADDTTVTIADNHGQRFVYRLGARLNSPILDAYEMERIDP